MKFGRRCCPVAEKSHRRCSTGSVVLCSIRKPHDFFFFFLSKAVEDFISTTNYMKQNLIDLKGELDKTIIIIQDFTPFSTSD